MHARACARARTCVRACARACVLACVRACVRACALVCTHVHLQKDSINNNRHTCDFSSKVNNPHASPLMCLSLQHTATLCNTNHTLLLCCLSLTLKTVIRISPTSSHTHTCLYTYTKHSLREILGLSNIQKSGQKRTANIAKGPKLQTARNNTWREKDRGKAQVQYVRSVRTKLTYKSRLWPDLCPSP